MDTKPFVVIDTNVFISMLLGSSSCAKVRDLFLDGLFSLALSEDMLRELTSTMSSPRFSRLIHPTDIAELLELLNTDASLFNITHHYNICRDPKDNMLLECATTAHARYIITGDKDLLVLKHFHSIAIVTPAQFTTLFK